MLSIQIVDGRGKINSAAVTGDEELCVIQVPHPPLTPQKVKPFHSFLTLDGTDGGDNDMGIDGSVTNVDFFIGANTDDRYITRLSFIVGYSASGKPFQWADGVALTNGSRLFYSNKDGEHDIHDAVKSNQDLFRLEENWIPTSWEVRHVNANNDFGYFINFDLTSLVPPFGVKLDSGTKQRLTMRIRDDAGADADTFNCIAYGFDRFK